MNCVFKLSYNMWIRCTSFIPTSFILTSDYIVKEKPLLVEDMQGGPDYIVLKNLDTDSVRIIGSVLGKSIALDHFVSQVDSSSLYLCILFFSFVLNYFEI